MSASTNSIQPKRFQEALEVINLPIDERSDFDLNSDDTYATFESLIRLTIDIQEAFHEPSGSTAAIANNFADNMRKLLPLAEAIATAEAKVKDGTLLEFLDHTPLRPNTVLAGLRKINQLMMASELCLRAVAVSLEYFIEHNVRYASKTAIAKKEVEALASVAHFPILLLTHSGFEAFSTQILGHDNGQDADSLKKTCGLDVCLIVYQFSYPFSFILRLLCSYAELPTSVQELRTLSKPSLLNDGVATKSILKLNTLFSKILRNPSFSLPDLHINRYMFLVVRMESIPSITNAFWKVQAQEDEISILILHYLRRWKTVKYDPKNLMGGVECVAHYLCIALSRIFCVVKPKEKLEQNLSTAEALQTLKTVGQEMIEFSTSPSTTDTPLTGADRLNLCMCGSCLLALRVFLYAQTYSLPNSNTIDAIDQFEALVPLSLAWVQCAHHFTNYTTTTVDWNILGCVTDLGFMHLRERVTDLYCTQMMESPGRYRCSDSMLFAIFKAQEAISTMIATAGLVFSKYARGPNFLKFQRNLYVIMPEASAVNVAFCTLMNENISTARYPKSAELCEAGLKAVVATTKALMWTWALSPREIIQSGLAYSDPNRDGFSMETLVATGIAVHHSVKDTLKAALMCCPFYGYSNTRVDPSSELSRKVGATCLKAFFALETKPHDDWTNFSQLDLFIYANCISYTSICGILQDPDPSSPYARTNGVFQFAIEPILASPEPWLENAVDSRNRGRFETEDPADTSLVALATFELAKNTLQKAMKDVVPGGEVQKTRAVARANAIATLQCGYVGCKVIMLPDQRGKLCNGCKVVRYCSEKCLKSDWKINHKLACNAIAADRK